jgi:hypothetical protein
VLSRKAKHPAPLLVKHLSGCDYMMTKSGAGRVLQQCRGETAKSLLACKAVPNPTFLLIYQLKK